MKSYRKLHSKKNKTKNKKSKVMSGGVKEYAPNTFWTNAEYVNTLDCDICSHKMTLICKTFDKRNTVSCSCVNCGYYCSNCKGIY